MSERRSLLSFEHGADRLNMWRGGSNAFSSILSPTEISVIVADSLLKETLRLFRVYPVVSPEVFEMMSATGSMKRVVVYSAVGDLFSHTDEILASVSTSLPFWLQPIRDSLAALEITQFNQQLRLCSPFHLLPSCSIPLNP